MRLTLKDVARIQIGYQARGRIENNPNGAYTILQAKDFDDNYELIEGKAFRISVEREPERYLVNEYDVLFLARGSSNYATVFRKKSENVIASNTFYILHVALQKIIPHYLAWYINQAQEKLRVMRQAQNIPLIPKAAFELMEIEVPPLSLQRTIVDLMELLKKEKMLTAEREQLINTACANVIDR